MNEPPASGSSSLRLLADQAFSRTAGAPLVGGNKVRLLKDAAENFPAWLDAIQIRSTMGTRTSVRIARSVSSARPVGESRGQRRPLQQ